MFCRVLGAPESCNTADVQKPDDFIPAGRTRETKISRDAEGRWFDDGVPLEHDQLCRAFDSWVSRAPDGRYCLHNDVNWAYITLLGPAFFARDANVGPSGVVLTLSDGTKEALAADTLTVDHDGRIYCSVKDGAFEARLDRAAVFALAEIVAEDEQGVYLTLNGQRIRPALRATSENT